MRHETHGNGRGWAVVTGGTSGIGREYARELAHRGCRVLITGRREQQLEAAAREIAAETGAEVEFLLVELADTEQRCRFVERVRQCSPLDVVVANAGFGHAEPFVNGPIETASAMIAVHVSAVVELFHAALPLMLRQGRGDLIAVSSLASRLPIPGSEIYVATKSFLNSFCESLALSVKAQAIRVQALLPGFTRTDFHRYDPDFPAQHTGAPLVTWMSPAAVVSASLRALERGHVVCIPGFSNRLIASLAGILPRAAVRAMALRASRSAPGADA